MEAIIDYIRDHPYESIGIIISAYVFLVIFCLPITQAHIMVAFAYCKAYNSFWLGFLMSTWIIFIGCMIGAFCAIILSRYIIADFIKRKLHKSKSVFGKKFKAVDQIFVTNGVFIVALIRLMYIPFGGTSYLLGITSISLWHYMIGTSFYLVMIMLVVLVGCSLYTASEVPGEENDVEIGLIIFEILITITLFILITWWAHNYVKDQFEEIEKEAEEKKKIKELLKE